MGYIAHDAVIVTSPSPEDFVNAYSRIGGPADPAPAVAAFRDSLPEEWRPLVVGPIPQVINGDVTYLFLPDGSKEGWGTSDEGDEYRRQFKAIFSFAYGDGSSPFNLVHVRFGSDHGSEAGGASIEYANDINHDPALAAAYAAACRA